MSAASEQDAAIVEGNRETAARLGRQRRDRRIELRDAGGLDIGGNGEQLRPARKEHLLAIEGEIVGRLDLQQGRDVVERRIGPERPVHRRDGDCLAAQVVEDGVEDHGFAPQ
jgi:hypothetical protein